MEINLDNHKLALNEFVWMWIASLSPILFGSLFLKYELVNVGYLEILLGSIEADTVFAYVATMIAPFFFILAQVITDSGNGKKTIKNIKGGGWLIVISIIIIVIIAGTFANVKSDFSKDRFNTMGFLSIDYLQAQALANEQNQENPQVLSQDNEESKTQWRDGLKEWLLTICYFVSIAIWYYTIYIKYKEAPDLQKDENKRVKDMKNQISDVLGG